MKITLFLVALPVLLAAQGGKYYKNVVRVRRPSLVAQTNSSDILYKDAANPFTLVGDGLLQYTLSINNGTLIPVVDRQSDTLRAFTILIDNHEPTTVKVGDRNGIHEFSYRNKPIPEPEAFLSINRTRMSGGTVAAEDFRQCESVGCGVRGYDGALNLIVRGMNVTRISADNRRTTSSIQGVRIADVVAEAGDGDIYIFHDIRVDRISETTQEMNPDGMVFFIVR